MVMRAQKKFDQLDTDGNGAVGGRGAGWACRVGVVELPSRRRGTERGGEGSMSHRSCLSRLDANDDGRCHSMSLRHGSGGRVQALSGTGEGWHRLMLQEERQVMWSSCVSIAEQHMLVKSRW